MGEREVIYHVNWREEGDQWRGETVLSGREADQLYWSLRMAGKRPVYVVKTTRERQQG